MKTALRAVQFHQPPGNLFEIVEQFQLVTTQFLSALQPLPNLSLVRIDRTFGTVFVALLSLTLRWGTFGRGGGCSGTCPKHS